MNYCVKIYVKERQLKKIEIPLNESPVASPGVPVYLISTISSEGINNIAPYGMVMPVSYQPLIYAVGSDKNRDTYQNILETKEFVLNVPSTKLLDKVNLSAVKFPANIDEFKKIGLTRKPAFQVKSSLIDECRSHIECKLSELYEINSTRVIILGEVLSVSIDREFYLKDFSKQKGRLDPLFYVHGDYFGIGRYVGKR